MRRTTVLFRWAAVFAVALMICAGTISQAAEQGEPKKITRLGGANTFYKVKGLLTADDLKTMAVDKKEDITKLLYEAGWQWDPELIFNAIAADEFSEVEFPVGGELQWMMYRKRGVPTLGYHFVWAGKTPFPAFKLPVKVKDDKNCKGYLYEFIIPKACGNLALFALDTEEYKADTKASAIVTPESGCVCTDLVLDAAGSSATMSGNSVLDKVMAKVVLPDGTEEGLGAPDSAGVHKWTLNYKNPGTYKFIVIASASGCGNTSDEATAVFEALPCPPVCDLDVDLAADYEGKEEYKDIYTGEDLNVDASGSEAKVTEIKEVEVKVYLDGDKVDEMALEGDLKTTVNYDRKGEYKFEATAFDNCDQKSDNDCDEALKVRSRWLPFVSILGGKERRNRFDLAEIGHCEPLVALKVGVGYMVIPRKFELQGALGYAFALDESDYSAPFVDLLAHYLRNVWFIGGGVGYWNFDDSDYADGNIIVDTGWKLPWWKINDQYSQFVIEGRVFFDELDDIGNNYVLLSGIKLNF